MRRRDLIASLAAMAAARPLAAREQQKVIGFLGGGSPTPNPTVGPVHQGLSETGYVEGQNLAVEYRWAEGHYDRLPALAADLVSRTVDLIVTTGGTPAALAAKSATATIPIVFIGVGDPVGAGLVANLARPGGNVTGISNIAVELMPKLLDLLSDLLPRARVIALLVNPNNPATEPATRLVQKAARAKGLELPILKVGSESEIDAAFASLVQLHAGGLVAAPDPIFDGRPKQFAELILRHAIPAIDQSHKFTASGGLISYGPSYSVINRQAGIYAGRILKGEKPADLPVQQPTKFDLVVNLRTAKALGITVPQSILARADEVIE